MKCIICGKEFEQQFPWQKYCSDECVKAGKNIANARYRHKKHEEKRPQFCLRCGKEFTGIASKLYCSDECRRKTWSEKRQPQKPNKYAIKRTKKPKTVVCQKCGKEFVPDFFHKSYCSLACQEAAGYFVKPKPKDVVKPKKSGKTLDDWCREADECNLDYGTYRALIAAGKSFDELKAVADSRNPQIHAHGRPHL